MKGQIITQQIKSINDTPFQREGFETINVLKWKDEKWINLCPYLLKTDGQEINFNNGGILFENFWQGSKVYPTVWSNEVYPSKYQYGNPKYLWWKYESKNKHGDTCIYTDSTMNLDTYLKWRNSIWNCKHPIRYPNKYQNKSDCKFALIIDKQGNQTRMNYLTFRKEVYVKEYIRLIKQTKEYQDLANMLKEGKNLMICEIDVPAKNKKGSYKLLAENSTDYEHNISQPLTKEYLETLLNDPKEPFGHGLALAIALQTTTD